MSSTIAADKSLFFSRSDAEDPRLGERVKAAAAGAVEANAWHIFGYPDDEGIRLNGGRPGACEAPDRIRRYLYRMTPSLTRQGPHLLDWGNLNPSAMNLSARHELGFQMAETTFQQGGHWLALGGGHDFGYCDAGAFAKAFATRSPLVINFDAHLDVRPTTSGPHSGTPFRRVLEAYPSTTLLEIGIQDQCNSAFHFSWARGRDVSVLTLNEILAAGESPLAVMTRFLLPHLSRPRPVFVSIDLDAFSSAYAPGCSQSWATGLVPNDVLGVLDFINVRGELKGAGLYEASPTLDLDDRTTKLAALLIHRLIHPPSQEV